MNGERFTLDSNVLVYSVDRAAGIRRGAAAALIRGAVGRDCWLTLQAVAEFFAIVTRKGLLTRAEASAAADDWLIVFPSLGATAGSTRAALALAARNVASFWDAMLLTAASEGGCRTIFSEDMQDGGVVGGLRVCNPFGPTGLSAEAATLLGL